ncbi:MAG: DUF1624 domain-containing protein [Clostridiales bacterium]|nr:DUF1624 domain-containing protein [Clostridiales bacterium]
MTEHSQSRWHLLDSLRGFTLLNMVLFHFLYDVFVIYGFLPGWNFRPLPMIWQQWICITFILIAGIVFHFSRSHLKRGLLLNLWGFLITLVTYFTMPDETIWFGILNFIGCGILLTALFEPFLHRIRPVVGFGGSLLLFLLTEEVPNGFLGCYGWRPVALPDAWYQYFPGALVGFPPESFSSSDYFSVIPWIFVFWAGYYLYFLFKDSPAQKWLMRGKIPFLSWIGKKTLWVYLLHQPLCMLICMAIWG